MGFVPVMKGLLVGLALALVLGGVFWYALPSNSAGGDSPQKAADLEVPTVTPTEADRGAQRQRAIEAKDPALLPICTEEYFANRPDPVPAKSMEPWDHPDQLGCRLPPPRPEDMDIGPRSERAPKEGGSESPDPPP